MVEMWQTSDRPQVNLESHHQIRPPVGSSAQEPFLTQPRSPLSCVGSTGTAGGIGDAGVNVGVKGCLWL